MNNFELKYELKGGLHDPCQGEYCYCPRNERCTEYDYETNMSISFTLKSNGISIIKGDFDMYQNIDSADKVIFETPQICTSAFLLEPKRKDALSEYSPEFWYQAMEYFHKELTKICTSDKSGDFVNELMLKCFTLNIDGEETGIDFDALYNLLQS